MIRQFKFFLFLKIASTLIFITLLVCHNLSFSKNLNLDPHFEITQWQQPTFEQKDTLGYDKSTFSVPEGLKEDVNFWIDIYTKYTTLQGVYHVAGDTQKILGAVDLTKLYETPKWSLVRKEIEGQNLIKREKKELAKKYKIDVKKIRVQMGLKDRMLEAIKISGLFFPMIEEEFKKNKIPLELSRVVFVESSFNLFARSKVGASGIWQVMPNISKKFKYVSESQDLRDHPYYATKIAAKIFKQNYQILKSWPLAVTGYNFGVGNLRKIVKKYNSSDISFLIDNVKSKKDFGFASKNFYATFLAALIVETNSHKYFPQPVYKFTPMQVQHLKTTKKIKYNQLLAQFNNDEAKLKIYNPHIKSKYLKLGKTLPVGTVISTPSTAKEKMAGTVDENFDF